MYRTYRSEASVSEVPVTRARAELADLVNRVAYSGEGAGGPAGVTGDGTAASAAVRDVLAAGDLTVLRLMLHPYVHWTEGGRTLRGRVNVLEYLTAHPGTRRGSATELRDG